MNFLIIKVITSTSMNLNSCSYEVNNPSGWCFLCTLKDGAPPSTNPCKICTDLGVLLSDTCDSNLVDIINIELNQVNVLDEKIVEIIAPPN